jgi:hypothetical protein
VHGPAALRDTAHRGQEGSQVICFLIGVYVMYVEQMLVIVYPALLALPMVLGPNKSRNCRPIKRITVFSGTIETCDVSGDSVDLFLNLY